MNEDKKKEVKEAIRLVLVVPSIERKKPAVFKATSREDANLLRTALSNPAGVKVRGPREEKKKVCPFEPDKPYGKTVCKKIMVLV